MRRHDGTAADRGGRDERGQAFTLEAVAAALVVLGSLLFALQASGVTSLSQSTSNRAIVEQEGAVAAGVLDRAAANGSIRPALLYYNDSEAAFHEPGVSFTERDERYYTGPPPSNLTFGRLLNETLGERNVAYNVDLWYLDASGAAERQPLVRFGQPSDDAARATRTVTLYDDDRLRSPNGTRTSTNLTNASSFYAPDRYPGGPVYNVVRVEVVVWRI